MKRTAIITAGLLAAGPVFSAEPLPSGDALLQKAFGFLARQTNFQVEAVQTLSVEGEGMLTRWETRFEIAVSRPDRIACLVTRGIMGGTLVSDGNTVTLYLPAMQTYSVKPAPTSLDDLAADAGSAGPMGAAFALLEEFLSSKPYQVFSEGLESVQVAGSRKLDGTDVYEVSGVAEDLGRVTVWIEKGAEPRIRRIHYDFSDLLQNGPLPVPEARMEMSVELSGWKTGGEIDPAVFRFSPPPDARRMEEAFGEAPEEQATHPMVGKAAPEFQLSSLDGEPVKLSDYVGTNVVVLDFWATWCPPCRRGLPVVSRIALEKASSGVVFFAVNQGEDDRKVRKFMEEHRLEFAVLMDRDQEVAKEYGVQGIPQTVIIGRDGKISSVLVGYGPGSEAKLRRDIEKAAAGAAPAGPARPETAP